MTRRALDTLPTLAERIDSAIEQTGGTMPLDLLVADDAEKAEALALLKDRHHAKSIDVLTIAEDAARVIPAPPPAVMPEDMPEAGEV